MGFEKNFSFKEKKGFLAIIFFLALIFLFSFFVVYKMDENTFLNLFNSYGFVGLFFAALLSNATILFPMPFDFLVFFLSASSNQFFFPLMVALPSALGAAIGELTSYFMGFVGNRGIEKIKKDNLEKLEFVKEKIGDYGVLFIFFGSLTPFPFDLIGIAAGLIKYDFKKFFFAALLGKLARFTLIGYSGMFYLSFIRRIFGF